MAGTTSTTNVHLNEAASITFTAFPVCESGPFVSVDLGGVAALLVHDLAVLDALAVQVAAAREALADLLDMPDLPPEEETTLVVNPPAWMRADG